MAFYVNRFQHALPLGHSLRAQAIRGMVEGWIGMGLLWGVLLMIFFSAIGNAGDLVFGKIEQSMEL